MKTLIRALLCFICFSASISSTADEDPPRYPKPVERPRPPVGPDGKPLVTLDGRWYSGFGYMDLEQDQWSFTGSYSCCDGMIRGELIAGQIEFSWEDPVYGEGWGVFKLDDVGGRLVGHWGMMHDMGSAGGWSAVRLEEREYAGELTRWHFTVDHPQIGEVRGEAVLYLKEERIAGQLAGSAETPSKDKPPYRHEIFRYLAGHTQSDEILLEWHNPLTERRGEILLTRTDDRLAGIWHFTEEIQEPVTFERLPE